MQKVFLNILKTVLPLALGVFLIWYYAQSLDEQGKNEIVESFQKANYGWILSSLIFAVLSHVSRAYRWKYILNPLGYKPDFFNSFFSVMIGYLVNLAIPRLGELSRCGAMSKYDNIPFEKLLGTVIAERFADFIILITITIAVVIIQIEVIGSLINEIFNTINSKISVNTMVIMLLVILLFVVLILYVFFNKKTKNPFILKVRGFIKGTLEGVASIVTMKNKGTFLAHTVFIWVMYLLMFYICFFSLPETTSIPFGGVLTAFVMGGFTIVLTNGGIGAYPLAIVQVLSLYGVSEGVSGAFGWIVWTAQTALILMLGAASFAFMPIYNKKIKKNVAKSI